MRCNRNKVKKILKKHKNPIYCFCQHKIKKMIHTTSVTRKGGVMIMAKNNFETDSYNANDAQNGSNCHKNKASNKASNNAKNRAKNKASNKAVGKASNQADNSTDAY